MANLDRIGDSAKFRALLNSVDMVAPVDSAVLIRAKPGPVRKWLPERFTRAAPAQESLCRT